MTVFRTVFGVSVDAALSRKGVRQYRYVSPPLSVCERLFLNDFWDRVAQFYPLWLAPNLVTLMGGCFVLLGTALLFVYSPRLQGTAPPWVYCIAALCLFGYQTCDGSDGKQARRTGAGSPLGHLFDHGLDSLVGTIVATWAVDFFGQGTAHLLFPLYISLGQLAFFLSNLVCVHRGSQVFYPMDVQEALLAIMAAFLLKGLVGTEILNQPSGPEGYRLPLWVWGTGLATLALLTNCCRYVWNTLLPHWTGAAPSGRRIETAFGHLLAISLHSLLVFLNLQQAPEVWHPGYVTAALSFSGLTLSLLLVVVTGIPFPALHWALVVQVALLLARDDPSLAWGIAAVAGLCLTHYVVQVGLIIKQELGIHVFRIKTRTPSPPPSDVKSDDAFEVAAPLFGGQELSHHVRIDLEMDEGVTPAHEDRLAP